MSWANACVGLAMNDPEAAQGIGFIVIFPLSFISTCFVPSQTMPGWMQPIAEWNPVSSVAAACRELFGNPNPAARSSSFPAQHPVFMSLAWSAVIVAVAVPLANHLLRKRTLDSLGRFACSLSLRGDVSQRDPLGSLGRRSAARD